MFALRPLLRYLHVTGLIEAPLVWAVPGVADVRDRSLPRGLEPRVVAGLLASCDRRTLVGQRDHAVLVLLVRLGLRAGEVAAIRLDDVDWRRGELSFAGRAAAGCGCRCRSMSVRRSSAICVVAVVRGSRAVFLRVCALRPAACRRARSVVVRDACAGPGCRVGAHRLRHTAATEMLGAGASLAEIAAGAAPSRARDDRDLRQGRSRRAAGAARPWPGGAA